jgi:hydrogenase maturation protein HypF
MNAQERHVADPHAAGADERALELAGRKVRVSGISQGVGFRPFVYRLACEEGLSGSVCNDATGVTIEAFGSRDALDRFVARIASESPAAARLDGVRTSPLAFERRTGFEIAASVHGAERRVSIPADLATCPECLAEIFAPGDRRYRYAFTNCTSCGPRFTIARDIPYDRPATTMARFPMCPECRREYQSPADRRFHAQPNACPNCGPRLRLIDCANRTVRDDDDPIRAAARAIIEGKIVAIKGIGGFHLACDATDPAAVRRLRERKHRDEKPFAVMVRDAGEAERLAHFTAADKEVLLASERPIVIVRRRRHAALAPEIAPGIPAVGLMLAYAPLHHLLMAEVGRPIVMTSGNLSEAPIAYRDDEAIARLKSIADLFVMHDREIVTRCDDSVVRVIAARATVMRRSRGYVPRPIRVAQPFSRPVLACGAQLKNTFCIGVGSDAYFGPHIGDLENLETFESFEESIARMERFLGVQPELIAHDLHPDYLSTAYALGRSPVPAVAVQHHHAHVASAMAEHRLAGPVLGIAFDGTGYGTDGHAWGGEFMAADTADFERLATFRPIALAGGDAAIRNVWRIALAMLDDAFDGAAPLADLALFRTIAPGEIEIVRAMIAGHLNAPLAHGVGRYFDAFGALALGLARANYEGQVAMRLEWVADPAERRRYRFDIDRSAAPWQIDLRAAVREAVRDLRGRVSAATISARFHNTLVSASAEIVRTAAARLGRIPIVLSGGCFQNARLAESIAGALSPRFDVYLHCSVPPGDGGIALGQAIVADAKSRKSAGGRVCA